MLVEKIKKYWPPLFLLASLLYFFREILFSSKTFVPFGLGLGDHNLSFVPLTHYLSESLKQGYLPLWDPYTLGGLPLTGGIQGYYHPLNFALFRFLPYPQALSFYIFSIFLILSFGTYFFVKSLKLSNEAALISSLSITFASGIVTRLIHLPILATFAYLPLLLLLTQKYFEKKNLLVLVLAGLTFALQISYGHQPAAFISSVGFVGFFLFKIFTETRPKKLSLHLLALLTICLVALALSAIQFIPGWQVFLANDRSKGINEIQFKEYPLHPGELTYLLQPTPRGTPSLGNYDSSPYLDPGIFWENTAYIGFLGLALAALALLFLSRSKKTVLFFGLLFLLSVVLALGKFTPLAPIWRIPPFSFFRMPSRFLLLAMFSLATLAGFGFDGLTQRYVKKRAFLGLFAAIIILIDLLPFDQKYNATYNVQKWLSPSQTAQLLKEDKSFFRYYSLGSYESYYDVYRQFRGWQRNPEPYYNLREDLALNLNLIYGLNIAGTGGGISKTSQWQSFLYDNLNVSNELQAVQPNSTALKMLRLLNVKYIVSYFEFESQDVTLKKKIEFTTGQPGFYLYELANPLPHAFIAHQAQMIKDSEESFKTFGQDTFNPQETVLLEEPFENLSSDVNSQSDKVEVTKYLPQSVAIRAKTASPGFLVLTDTHFPGWEAKIDGQPTKIYQTDALFRAVRIEPGEHQVEYEYKPQEFYLGTKISLGTLALITIFTLFWILKSRISKNNIYDL